MNDQLERIDFISTVLIIRHLEKKFKSMINTPCRLLELWKIQVENLDKSNFTSCKKLSIILLQFYSPKNERRASE